jgi:outer membrane lipoprotein-sorting protein
MSLSLLVFALLLSLCTQAQITILSPIEQQKVKTNIMEQLAELKTMSCRFEQTKHVGLLQDAEVSQGTLSYTSDSKLRWEYKTPHPYVLVLNGKKTLTKSGSSRYVMDAKSSKFFQVMIKIVVSCITGEGLTDEKNFQTEVFRNGKQWEAVLTPKQRELRKMFTTIRFLYSEQDYTMDVVELNEPNKDHTRIRFFDKKINEPIDNIVFTLRVNKEKEAD